MKIKFISLFLLILLYACSLSTPILPNKYKKISTADIAGCIRSPMCHKLFVCAHRGEGFGAPENSREAAHRVVSANIPIMEIDLRLSKDNKIFVMHDATIDRTASWHGYLKDYTSDELKFINLENGEAIPMLDDLYQITRGRAVLLLDIKGGPVKEVVMWIAQYGSFDDVIFAVNSQQEFESASQMKQQYPAMMISAEAYNYEDLQTLGEYFNPLPEIIDFGFPFPWRFALANSNQKINASLLVFEIGLPFTKMALPYYPNIHNIDILMTNDPIFWTKKLPNE